jgi:hypothetical protein
MMMTTSSGTIIKTYDSGPIVMITKPITYDDFAQICKKIQSAMNDKYKVVPEGISEGGIKFIDNYDHSYKSFRIHAVQFHYYRYYYNYAYKYPIVDHENPFASFEESDKILIGPSTRPNKKYIGGFSTFLKAFHKNVEPWTNHELNMIEKVFNEYGCTFVKKPNMDLV